MGSLTTGGYRCGDRKEGLSWEAQPPAWRVAVEKGTDVPTPQPVAMDPDFTTVCEVFCQGVWENVSISLSARRWEDEPPEPSRNPSLQAQVQILKSARHSPDRAGTAPCLL